MKHGYFPHVNFETKKKSRTIKKINTVWVIILVMHELGQVVGLSASVYSLPHWVTLAAAAFKHGV